MARLTVILSKEAVSASTSRISRDDVRRQAGGIAGVEDADAVGAIEVELGREVLLDEPHQEAYLLGRPLPVLGREDIEREELDAEILGGLYDDLGGLEPLAVPFGPRAGRETWPSGRCRP